jgi:hypothetical protein
MSQNGTTNMGSDEQFEQYTLFNKIFVWTWTLLGLVGNSAIIVATVRPSSGLKSKSNYLICILALCDLFTNEGFAQVENNE